MTQYIDKSALVAEVERRKIPFKRDIEEGYYPTYLCAPMDFEDSINTLEVKEVDLEKEIDKYFDEHDEEFYREEYLEYAKHFFELGLKAKGEEI